MSDIAIRVENLGKQYRIGGPRVRYKTLRDSVMGAIASPIRRFRNPQSEIIWALKDVSFEVKRGEMVGIPSFCSGLALAAMGPATNGTSPLCRGARRASPM